MKIIRKQFDAGTISAPAFIDLWFDSGEHVMVKGKEAKRLNREYKIGDDWPEYGWHKGNKGTSGTYDEG